MVRSDLAASGGYVYTRYGIRLSRCGFSLRRVMGLGNKWYRELLILTNFMSVKGTQAR